MSKRILSSPHKHGEHSIRALMLQVLIALAPALILYVCLIGWGVLIQCFLSICFALVFETLALKIRGLPVNVYLNDLSAILTAVLFSFCISPFAPWWISFFGIAFAILIVKHAYGGIGNNLFNPAIGGYVFVLVCFPAELLSWPSPYSLTEINLSLLNNILIIFTGSSSYLEFDAISSATPLNFLQSELRNMGMLSEIKESPVFGLLAGKSWEIINAAFIMGGLYLIARGVIKWQIPATVLLTFFLISLLFHWYDADIYAPPLFHIFSGGTLLIAFFIATDPVSSCSTPRGKIYYAIGIACLAYVIRTWGAYPDGFAFAVLIMNAAVPWLDSITRPAILGEQGD